MSYSHENLRENGRFGMQSQDLTDWRDRIETYSETVIFACRWLLAPFYIGLAISIVVLLIKFLGELSHLVLHAFSLTEPDVVLGVLTLVDMALVGSLLIIVIFSGYENFVSRFNLSNHKDWPAWMGTIDFSALKLKLLSSIVAISAIQLLKQFMSLQKVSDRDLYWLVVIHVVFVISSVLLALSDRISGHEAQAHAENGPKNSEKGHRTPAAQPHQHPEPKSSGGTATASTGGKPPASASPSPPASGRPSGRDANKGNK